MGAQAHFERRLREIEQRHERLKSGREYRVGRDGLILAHPRRVKARFPLQGILMILLVGIAFKTFLFMNMGQGNYDATVAALANGSIIEMGGAWIMQSDPVTHLLAQKIATSLH